MHAVRIGRTYKQLVRYAAMGVLMNFLGYLLYVCATAIGLWPKAAMTLIYASGVLLNFLISRKWVFRHQGAWNRSFVAYVTVYLAGYAINYSLLWLLVDRMGWHHLLVQALAIVLVAGFLFVSLKLFVFRDPEKVFEKQA